MRFFSKILLVLFFFFGLPVHGQSGAEQIQSFDSSISIQKTGRISVKEKIVYDFGSLERHGIFRYIENIKENQEGKRYRMEIEIQSVRDENNNDYQYKVTEEGDKVEVRIGDPDEYVSGIKTYVISYTVSGALTYFSDHDELYWDMNGFDWDVPIQTMSSTLTFPESVDQTLLRGACYTGSYGSETSDCTVEFINGGLLFSTNRPLYAGENMSIISAFPQGIAAVLEPKEVIPFEETLLGKLVIVSLLIAAFIWYIVYPLWLPIRWFLHGRDPKGIYGEASAWYDPPQTKSGRSLTPAETGTLVDENAGPREIAALVVDLARRGYFKIIEKKKDDYEFEKTKEFSDDPDLQESEKIFLTELFAVKSKVRIKDADLYDVVSTIHKRLYSDLVTEGYFPENPDKVRKHYAMLSGIASVTFNFILLISASIFGRLMPRKTLEGVHAANRAKSLKNFLKSQDRQLEYQAQNQMFFEKLLPFAVAFGVEKVWAERFKDIKMTAPDWYVGSTHGAFNSSSFTRSIGASTASFNSAATPTTSSTGHSSGFSSGGGFSGGGGGGGGGGSW